MIQSMLLEAHAGVVFWVSVSPHWLTHHPGLAVYKREQFAEGKMVATWTLEWTGSGDKMVQTDQVYTMKRNLTV